MNEAVKQAGGTLTPKQAQEWRVEYRACLKQADSECPPPDETQREGKRGKLKRSKSRNLLERLRCYEADVLRFLEDPNAPFTNNQGERDIRMLKVHQKVSGCFRSMGWCEYPVSCPKLFIKGNKTRPHEFRGYDIAF